MPYFIVAYWMHGKTSETVDESNCEDYWYDVFLGGTCATSTWRQHITIPLLKYVSCTGCSITMFIIEQLVEVLFMGMIVLCREHQISYFNPHVTRWSEALIPYETRAKEKCHILLYVITGHSTSVGSLVEVF